MPIRHFLSEFEELVMLATMKLGENAYGVPISELIEQVTGKRVSFGTLYSTLQKLEGKGFVSSRMGQSTPERGGRAKKYFTVENAGRLALASSHQVRTVFKQGLDLDFAQ